MTNFNIAKAKNHPMNRDGETITVIGEEGDLVGLRENVDGEAELVAADAASGTQQPAMGILMEEVQDPSDINVNGFEDAYIEQRQLRRQVREEDYTLVGDEGTYIYNGIMLENVDEDTDLVPNEPVYLGVGGGFTQTEPSATGELVQRVGIAVDEYRLILDVEFDYSMV